ncbi:hypothetical protein CC1G_05683 [Coprinopsis cinerea okayama7|uniref:Xylanolytic transcriptional activator regulatory domain-containing protein n=1 Tax=Coprinopsis cinerea (strain Okayama-7 / 130 / ATCC MYA-4618 / FGSC 9003) TaxID=240176 RepID=A8N9V6_COPC7|nr:hypothetical protein CC1G_05683 [Coprinopsis cinerea okayama7\|eukprot:XP_001831612.2 hypothetical protein CC1G_05683 [Coprinopsis cinerea okayama7\
MFKDNAKTPSRFVLASTQELHEKINELAQRVRDLEDALRVSHAQLSTEQHPLLTEELLKIKAPLQREPATARSHIGGTIKEEEQSTDIPDAFGSLSISSVSGRTKYFGHIANSWNESPEEDGPDDSTINNLRGLLPAEILTRASAFPVSPMSTLGNVGLGTLRWFLPYANEAQTLCQIFYSHAAWMYNPINQETFEEEVYSQFYQRDSTGNYSAVNGGSIGSEEPIAYHRLSLMFMVLAIGSLMNTSMQAYNLEAEKYHQLARAALFHTSLFDEPTLNAVQALFLMTYYMFLADRHGSNTGARWGIMGITIKVAQSRRHLSDRDSGRWKVNAEETQRRRELFWELFTYDSWQCYTFGRPPSFALPHIDTKMPFINDKSDEHAFHAWKHKFSSECMNLFHDQAFGAKTPTYATVLQLDRKMRAFPVPPVLQVAGFGNSDGNRLIGQDTVQLTLQRHIVLAIREMNLLYLHRSFFARAMSDHPKDPLGSPYGTSVIAAYRSAGSLVALMRNLHSQLKEPSERMWFLWTHMFSCAIVLGSIVTRCPSMSLAQSALGQLESACDLFAKAARGFRATKVLNIMLHLRSRAQFSLDEYRRGNGSPITRLNPADPSSPTEEDDELSILGGKTRLVSKEQPSSPRLLERSPTSQNPVVPLPLPSSIQSADPNLAMYLRSFNPSQNPPQSHHHQSPSISQSSSGNSYTTMDAMHSSDRGGSYGNELELSPVSMYGMSAIPTTNYSSSSENASYMQQQQHQAMQNATAGPSNPSSTMMDVSANGFGEFPQYFPVYDYGSGGMSGGNTAGYGPSSPMLEGSGLNQRRSSGSPEAGNLQTTWQDFVDTIRAI